MVHVNVIFVIMHFPFSLGCVVFSMAIRALILNTTRVTISVDNIEERLKSSR